MWGFWFSKIKVTHMIMIWFFTRKILYPHTLASYFLYYFYICFKNSSRYLYSFCKYLVYIMPHELFWTFVLVQIWNYGPSLPYIHCHTTRDVTSFIPISLEWQNFISNGLFLVPLKSCIFLPLYTWISKKVLFPTWEWRVQKERGGYRAV